MNFITGASDGIDYLMEWRKQITMLKSDKRTNDHNKRTTNVPIYAHCSHWNGHNGLRGTHED